MKQIRKRLTYANVMSSIAVFLVLGGASALAASQLGKNSVGSKQLKKNAVTTAKIKKEAVTGAKIKKGAITGAHVKAGSLTGANINSATLGTVPSATNASSAGSVNGQVPTKIFKTLNAGQSNVTVATIAGFTITASCESANVDVTLTSPATPASVLIAEGNGSPEGSVFEYDSQESGTASSIPLDGNPDNHYGETSFSGALNNGTVVSGDIGYDYDTFGDNPENVCVVEGEATTG